MISIIVPVYNAEKYLTDCVDSVLGQTTTEPLEIILVDDGSTDNSLFIAQQYAKKHAEDPLRRILLLTQQHSGQSIARNLGMEKATGEYIAFVDADDRIAPDWCNRHLAAIKGVDYVQSGYRRTSDAEEKGWRVGFRQLPEHRYRYTSPCMRLYRRSALRNIRFEGGMIYEDVIFSADLWLSGASCKQIKYAGYLYTKNPDSTTSRVHLDAQKRVLEELHNRLPMASWKGKGILWLTIIRLKLYFMKEMRKNVNLLTLIALLMLSTASLQPATYYVSPDGTGNGLSKNTPTSFAGGLAKLAQPGDTLYLLSGQYDLNKTTVQNLNGTASKRIVISGYDGITRGGTYDAILDFRTTTYGTRGLQIANTCTYLHIKNLTLRYSGKNNLYNEGSYCLFENLDIYGSSDTGCQMKVGGNNIIKNVDSHDNFDYENMRDTQADFGGNADGFADKQFTGAGNHYIGCRAWNNSDDGWDFFQRVSSSSTIIENCICYQNGQPYYDMSNHPRATGVDKTWFDSKVGKTMTDRFGNTITISLSKYPNMGNGNGFKLGGGNTLHDALVHHCLSVANNVKGFDQNSDAGKLYLYNNTAYSNGAGGGSDYGFYSENGCRLYIQNCISFQSKGTNSLLSSIVQINDHNSWNNGFSVSASDFRSLDTTLILAPRNGNGDLPDNDFMRLAEGSSLIDAGIDVNLGYNDLAPDLGCYEYPGEHHEPEPIDTIPTIQPEGTHSVAFVTIPGCAEDKPLLKHLRANDSLWVVETEATDPNVDYSEYEVIVLSPKPNSGAAGFSPLKGYDKPMVLLKSFLLKNSVWNWGNAVNTQDVSVLVTDTTHPLFRGLTLTDNDELTLFSQCNTNAVTAISAWTNTNGVNTLATPISQPTYTTIAELPAGTNCNGTILPQRMVMIGVSEYSSADLTQDGKQLIENAILYLLGITMPSTGIENHKSQITNHKFIKDGQLYIQAGSAVYDATGRKLCR